MMKKNERIKKKQMKKKHTMDFKMFVTLIHVRNKMIEKPKCYFVDISILYMTCKLYIIPYWINYGRDRRTISSVIVIMIIGT